MHLLPRLMPWRRLPLLLVLLAAAAIHADEQQEAQRPSVGYQYSVTSINAAEGTQVTLEVRLIAWVVGGTHVAHHSNLPGGRCVVLVGGDVGAYGEG
jgi:hypothetical protein